MEDSEQAVGATAGEGADAPRPRIVVGVDASSESEEALRWAVRYAELVGGAVEVVHAWHLPDEVAWLQSLPPPAGRMDVAREALAEIVERAVGQGSSVGVTTEIIEGRAAKVLVDKAKGAALLVVGHRGLGGFDGVLLGSVSATCLAHAPCSVVVVRGATGADEPGQPS
jgi:nucleotide-binding universal stress UspA family protein